MCADVRNVYAKEVHVQLADFLSQGRQASIRLLLNNNAHCASRRQITHLELLGRMSFAHRQSQAGTPIDLVPRDGSSASSQVEVLPNSLAIRTAP